MSLSVGAAVAQTFATATTTSERGDMYGVFGYSGVTIGILVAVVVGLIAFVGLLYQLAPDTTKVGLIGRNRLPGILVLIGMTAIIAIDVIATLLTITMWTSFDWEANLLNALLTVAGSAVIVVFLIAGNKTSYQRFATQ